MGPRSRRRTFRSARWRSCCWCNEHALCAQARQRRWRLAALRSRLRAESEPLGSASCEGSWGGRRTQGGAAETKPKGSSKLESEAHVARTGVLLLLLLPFPVMYRRGDQRGKG